MRAIDHRHYACSARPAANFGHREDDSCGRGDMADENQLCALGHTAPEMFDYLLVTGEGQRDGAVNVASASERAIETPGTVGSAVFVVSGEDFVAGLEVEGAGHDVHAVGCIGDENEVVGV